MKMKAGLIRTSWTGVPWRQTFQHQEINHTNWKDCYLSEPEAAEVEEAAEEEEDEFSGQKKFFSFFIFSTASKKLALEGAHGSFQLSIMNLWDFFFLLKPLQETL